MPAKNYDLLIIGGGLVGASLAIALADTDLTIAIVEATPKREINREDLDARSIVLAYSTEKIFQTLGVWSALTPYLTPIKMIHISDRGHFGVTRIRAEQHDVAAMGYAISAPALASVLYQQLDNAANVTWIRPATVTKISKNSVIVNDQEIMAQLIIVADGANSKTCELLNMACETTDYNQSAIVANLTIDRDHKNIAYERFTAQGPIALLPMAGQCMTAVWTQPHAQAQERLELSDAEFLTEFQSAFGFRAGKFMAAKKRVCYPLNLTLSQEQQANGVLILGNAAHALHPVSAQGFNLGLRDVAQLAEDILAVEKEKLSNPELLENYLAARKNDQESTVQYTDDLVRIFSTEAFPITPLRGIGLSKLNSLPMVKNIIVRRAMGLRGKASKLLRGIKISS